MWTPVSKYAIIFILNLSLIICHDNKRQYDVNADFLQHERGSNVPKSNDPTPHLTLTSTSILNNNQQSAKRDYVAPNPAPTHASSTRTSATSMIPSPSSPNSNTQTNSGKRDYVAPQWPALKPVDVNNRPIPTPQPTQNNAQSTGGRRDYVAPEYTMLKPPQGNNQQSTGKVKDLINLYDSKSKDQNQPQGVSSYSSIVQGNKNGPSSTPNKPTSALPASKPSNTVTKPKPISFSGIVAGSTKPGSTNVTPKPTTTVIPKPISTNNPVLPSSLANKNQNSQTGSSRVSDTEIQTLSEELLRKDVNNAARYVTVNYQEKTTSQSKEDKAPLPLMTVSPEVWNIPTIQTFLPLLDNYERDTLVNEHVTPQERNEENAFMDAVMSTTVIRHLMNFLKDKGYVTPDPRQQRDFLKQLWFNLYSRGKGKISSSGFEHVFVSELKNGEVSGLHNWIYFTKEETARRVNYLGYLKYEKLNDRGVVLKLHFNHQGVDKPVSSMFIGTSPELEMALYTLCFVTRSDSECKLKLGSKNIDIQTYTFRYRSKNMIGSAFPQLPFAR